MITMMKPIRDTVRNLESICELCQSRKCWGCKQVVELFGKKITIRMRDKEVIKINGKRVK